MSGIATGQIVSFQIGAEPTATAGFTSIEVFRSRSGIGGPYEEITGPIWSVASISVAARNTLISGKELKLRVLEKNDVSVVFSGSDPLIPTTIASQIQVQGLGLVQASFAGTTLTVMSTQPGAAATIRILESDGAALLGLPTEEPDSVGFGTDARIPINPNISGYSFQDPHGSSDYYYRVRFINNDTLAVSSFSAPFQVTERVIADPAFFITGVVQLVDVEGHPVESVEVRVRLHSSTTLLGDALVVNTTVVGRTDVNGQVTFSLPRGGLVTVAIAGTNIVRDVSVPTDDTLNTFNLLDPLLGQDDAFKVQRPEINYAVRRSL